MKTPVSHILDQLRLPDRIRAVVFAYRTGIVAQRVPPVVGVAALFGIAAQDANTPPSPAVVSARRELDAWPR